MKSYTLTDIEDSIEEFLAEDFPVNHTTGAAFECKAENAELLDSFLDWMRRREEIDTILEATDDEERDDEGRPISLVTNHEAGYATKQELDDFFTLVNENECPRCGLEHRIEDGGCDE